jgi:hypothetical protein
MESVSLRIIAPFAAAVVSQIISAILLLRTNGFTSPLATLGCVAALMFGVWVMARLVHGGVSLGILRHSWQPRCHSDQWSWELSCMVRRRPF